MTADHSTDPVGARYRSWPEPQSTLADVGELGVHVSDLMLPAMVLRQDALHHNANLVATWAHARGFELAPHGKTTMSRELIELQLRHGAWAITAATAGQARVFAEWGVPRVLLANEVTDPGGLRWVAETVAEGRTALLVLVDSTDGVGRLGAALAATGTARRLDVLLEWGIPGGRAGVRDRATGRAVAEAVLAMPQLRLAGVECFEGVAGRDRSDPEIASVRAMLDGATALLAELGGAGALEGEVLLTAGGSSYPDLVVEVFGAAAPPAPETTLRRVLRSGGYLTHDHGMLERTSPMRRDAHDPAGTLEPALRLVASVLSIPEPGLAIVGFGKRDAPYDIDLPVALGLRRRADLHAPAAALDPADVVIGRCNDQHAFATHDDLLEVGDQLVFGISHPCTAFDKWTLLPVVDEDDRVVGTVTTSF